MRPFTRHTGRVYVLDRADIDTDQIVPKQFLKRVERTGFGEHLFCDWRKSGEIEIPPDASILVTGRNFGCGSSREHAAWALEDFGFRAIVAPSFADIFFSNCTKVGLLPVALPQEQVRCLVEGDRATVDLEKLTIELPSESLAFEFDGNLRQRFLEGLDEIAMTLQREAEIAAFEGRNAAVG